MPTGTTIALVIAAVIVLVIVAVFVIFIVWLRKQRSPDKVSWNVPILDAMDRVTYENLHPPATVSYSIVPYTLIVESYNVTTRTGVGTLAWLEDLGLSQGIAYARGNILVSSDMRSLTFSNFAYIRYPGSYAGNLPQGPFTFSLQYGSTALLLTGHYNSVQELLTRAP